jgi:Ca2+-binding RTX toxin-like protein
LNQLFGTAAALDQIPAVGGIDGAGVSVTGGVAPAGNAGYVVYNTSNPGAETYPFGIKYTGDTLWGYSADPDYIQGTPPINSTLNGAAGGPWSLLGGSGNDSIIGGANNDIALGGNGNDSIFGGAGNDSLLGEAGNDTIDGGNGLNTLRGGLGDDSLLVVDDGLARLAPYVPGIPPSGTNNTLMGDEGNDAFYFGKVFGTPTDTYLTSTTSLVGGTGTDTIRFADGNVTVADAAYTDVSEIEWIVGGAGNDSFSFGLEASTTGLTNVQGGNGNDTFGLDASFSASNVTFAGGAGDDRFEIDNFNQLSPTGQSNRIDGEVGVNDVLAISNLLGTAAFAARITDQNVTNIEELRLANGTGAPTDANYVNLITPWGIQRVFGGTGAQNIINAQPAITVGLKMYGAEMSDQLGGGGSGDILKGWSNAAANNASDTFTGGAGADTFVFAEAIDINNAYGNGNSNSPIAVITDFQADAGRDKLQLKDIGGAGLAANYSLTFAGSLGTLTNLNNSQIVASITVAEGTASQANIFANNIALV